MLSRRGMLAGLSGLSLAGCAQHPAAPLPVAGPDPRIDYDKLANPRADFAASLWPSVPSLRPGMPLSLAMRSSIAGYASLFAAHSSNATSQLIGNRVIGAGETRSVGPYQAVPPAGLETYILVVTRAPLVSKATATGPVPSKPARLKLDPAALVEELHSVLAPHDSAHWATAVVSVRIEPA